MKFKDLFKTNDNISYETRENNLSQLYTKKNMKISHGIYMTVYDPVVEDVVVFINKPWYQRTQRYLISFR